MNLRDIWETRLIEHSNNLTTEIIWLQRYEGQEEIKNAWVSTFHKWMVVFLNEKESGS